MGLNTAEASWGTQDTLFHRIDRLSRDSGFSLMSSPLNGTNPENSETLFGSIFMIALAKLDFPLPLSPTTASASPACLIVKETRSRAVSFLLPDPYDKVRSLTSRSGGFGIRSTSFSPTLSLDAAQYRAREIARLKLVLVK